MTTTARSPTQPSTTLLSPKPRRPNGGILLRNPSSDCSSPRRNRCVKWNQKECEVFQVDDWDRSPCSVTPKLTYRDLVELKQLELDKVPHSPFRHLADLPMPIGLPRVGIQLQPMFDSQSSEAGSSSSSSSGNGTNSTSPSTNVNVNPPTNAIKTDQGPMNAAVVGLGPAKAAPTPRSSPAPTPPRSESPHRQDAPALSVAPATPPGLPASPSSSSDNGGFSKYCPQRRTHTPSCSASHLAKRRSPTSPSASLNTRMASVPPPPVFSPTLNQSSFSTLQQNTPVAESAKHKGTERPSSDSTSSSQPNAQTTRSKSLAKVEEEEPSDSETSPSSPSHPALVLTNALLEQELQDSERSRKAVFGSPTSSLSSPSPCSPTQSPERKSSGCLLTSAPSGKVAAIKRKFAFMPLLPSSDGTATQPTPSLDSQLPVVPSTVLDHPMSDHEMALHALADHPHPSSSHATSHGSSHLLGAPSSLGSQRSPSSPLQFEVLAGDSGNVQGTNARRPHDLLSSASSSPDEREGDEDERSERTTRPPIAAHEDGSDDGTMHSGCEQSESDLTDVDDHHPAPSNVVRKPSETSVLSSSERKRSVLSPTSASAFGALATPPSSAIGALKVDTPPAVQSGPRRPSVDGEEASAGMERSNSLGIELGHPTPSSEPFGETTHRDDEGMEKMTTSRGGNAGGVRVLMDEFSPLVSPLSSA